MNNIFDGHAAGLGIEIYDGDELPDRTLMHDSSGDGAGIFPLFRTAQSLDIVGHKRTMEIHSLPAFNPAAEHIEKIGSEEVIGRNVTEVFP